MTQQTAVPGPDGGPGTSPYTPARPWLGALARRAADVISRLRLVGSQCCVGRADTAWQRTRDREPRTSDGARRP
ncbi:MAG TPA: hypothetical protein VH307_21215 [Streptosporangiaceae bacterium]|nr:hypothetical protein [Streptosporangiaceae bacterium]